MQKKTKVLLIILGAIILLLIIYGILSSQGILFSQQPGAAVRVEVV